MSIHGRGQLLMVETFICDHACILNSGTFEIITLKQFVSVKKLICTSDLKRRYVTWSEILWFTAEN
jgi:hypothetical protein